MSMVVNNNNELVILGNTNSDDFPTTAGSFDQKLNDSNPSNYDIFISILSENGSNLVGSTYIGGDNNDGLNGMVYFYGDDWRGEVIIDSQNNIYVACNTQSTSFPVTANSFDTTYNGSQDACVFKMNSNASKMIWSGFLGGIFDDQSSGIALDNDNNVFVCGGTESSGFPITAGVVGPSFRGGWNLRGVDPLTLNTDGFVTKIDSGGNSILASSFIQSSGSDFDMAYMIELDMENNPFIFGVTEGDYPITAGVYNNGGSSQFIHKLSPDLQTTFFSSTFGNDSIRSISPTALMVDTCNRIYVSGWGGVVSFEYDPGLPNKIYGFPLTSNAFQSSTDGDDFYLAVFNKDMASLNYATYFGGNPTREHVDGGTSRFSPDGTVYQAVCAGCGGSSAFPSTPGAYSTINRSTNCNAAVFKMEFAAQIVDAGIENPVTSDTIQCTSTGLVLDNLSSNANEYFWYFGDGDTLHTYSDSSVTHQYDSAGFYEVILVSYNDGECFSRPIDTAFYQVVMAGMPAAIEGKDTTLDACDSLQLSACCGISYLWEPGKFLSDSTIANPILLSDTTQILKVIITDSIGCTSIDSINIDINEPTPFIPNILTPNGDGINDEFIIDGICREHAFTLYNRWGRKVYFEPKYNGKFTGKNLPDGLYFYSLTSEYKNYKGWIQINH